jgi:hypothetical protein
LAGFKVQGSGAMKMTMMRECISRLGFTEVLRFKCRGFRVQGLGG